MRVGGGARVVPADTWYLLGDNRAQSIDSRYWGPIPTEWIIGKVKLGPGQPTHR